MLKTVNTKLKAILSVAIALLIGIITYSTLLYLEKEENEKILTEEKEKVIDKYGQMIYYYQVAMKQNTALNEKLLIAKERVSVLLDSMQNSEMNFNSLWKYKAKYIDLQKEMVSILNENDELKVENKYLTTSIDSTKIKLEERIKYTDSLLAQNIALAAAIESASVLSANNMKVDGVIQRSSGKQVSTEKARKSDKIRVCFTVAKNKLVEIGDKEVFVQVIDPKNNIIGLNKKVTFEEESLNYSMISKFTFENENLDVCEFISKSNKKDDFEKGLYRVNVFDERELITSTQFALR